jgi:hypothetical protein
MHRLTLAGQQWRRHEQKRSLLGVNRPLCHRRQHAELSVGYRGSGTRLVRPVAAHRARLPIHGLGAPGGHNGALERRQQRGKFLGSGTRSSPGNSRHVGSPPRSVAEPPPTRADGS